MNAQAERAAIQLLVDQVAGLKLAAYGGGEPDFRGANFHLHPCYCGAPMWQQPCALCGYYPQYGEPGTDWPRRSCTFEDFARPIEHHGNLIAWFFFRQRRVVAYKPGMSFTLATDWAYTAATQMKHVPTAREIWNYFQANPKDSVSAYFRER